MHDAFQHSNCHFPVTRYTRLQYLYQPFTLQCIVFLIFHLPADRVNCHTFSAKDELPMLKLYVLGQYVEGGSAQILGG